MPIETENNYWGGRDTCKTTCDIMNYHFGVIKGTIQFKEPRRFNVDMNKEMFKEK